MNKQPYAARSGERVVLRLKVKQAVTFGDVRSAVLLDEQGLQFSGRIPDWGLNGRQYRPVSAIVSHVGLDGIVYLKNVRRRKS